MSLTPITVVLVFTPEGDTFEERLDAPPTGPALEAWNSVREQDYPADLLDVVLVRNVEGLPLEEMQVYGAKQATTDWVAFIGEDEMWAPYYLSLHMEQILHFGWGHFISPWRGLVSVNRKTSPLWSAHRG